MHIRTAIGTVLIASLAACSSTTTQHANTPNVDTSPAPVSTSISTPAQPATSTPCANTIDTYWTGAGATPGVTISVSATGPATIQAIVTDKTGARHTSNATERAGLAVYEYQLTDLDPAQVKTVAVSVNGAPSCKVAGSATN